jgi:adenylate kinase family enzyme
MTTEDNAATRQALIHIGFPQTAAQAFFYRKEIDSLDKIALSKDEEITALCKIVQQMGRADDNEGHIVSQRVKENLKLTGCLYD